jgi:DNA polymerase (family 10)
MRYENDRNNIIAFCILAMKKTDIVTILDNIAILLELKGESIFKSRAYKNAARSIEFISEDVD